MATYVGSTRNLTGLALATVGPALALLGGLGLAACLALAVGLYVIGAVVAPPRRRPDLVAGVAADDVQQSLDGVKIRVRGRVPIDVESRVRLIATTIADALPRADSLPAGGKARYSLVKTATDYLPSTLDAYLALPRRYAEQEVVAGGKTAAALLCDQLDLLAIQMTRIAELIRRSDADRLVTNGRFLADRFGGEARTIT